VSWKTRNITNSFSWKCLNLTKSAGKNTAFGRKRENFEKLTSSIPVENNVSLAAGTRK